MKKISIIVPVYNVKEYLEQCIDSLINQTYKNLEIIIVDDGSTDGSYELCEELKKRDDRIILYHKLNGGLSDARNFGLERTTGSYIGFVDSDDWVSVFMYEELINMIDKYQADIACCGRYICRNGKKYKKFTAKETCYTSKEALREILLTREIDVAMWDKLFRSELFRTIRFPVGENNEDIAIFYKLIGNSKLIVHTGSIGYYYRKRQGSITHSAYSSHKAKVLQKHLNELEKYVSKNFPELGSSYRRYLAMNNYFLLSEYIQKNGTKKNSEYNMLLKIFNENFFELITHRNFEFKRKIAAIFIRLNLYFYYEKLKKVIGGSDE